MDCLCSGLYLYITFTQSHQPEEAISDSYDKCGPGFEFTAIFFQDAITSFSIKSIAMKKSFIFD